MNTALARSVWANWPYRKPAPAQGVTIQAPGHHYQSPLVRALAWSCFQPSLLSSLPGSTIGTPGFALTPARRQWLTELDRNDAPLRQFLNRHCATPRLGLRFESLWHFFLAADSDTQLLAHNLAVREAGRTLGEFDILYYSHPLDRVCHLELAVKFYLHLGSKAPGGPLENWLGPNRIDRLDRKLQRLQQQQLPLSQSEAGRQCLAQIGIDDCLQQFHLGGRLFVGAGEQVPVPPFDPRHASGQWQTLADFLHRPQQQWRYLDKPDWLDGHYEVAASLTTAQLKRAETTAIMLVNPAQQYQIIVPAHWPGEHRIPL